MATHVQVSTVRREDWQAYKEVDVYARTRNSAGAGSTTKPRGHMGPAAFMMIASGLEKVSATGFLYLPSLPFCQGVNDSS